ncbi:hypothetical protein [Pseudomonas sp. LS_2]|uniref:hypothetical protein n=1 Tax=Pseudomonas sp. LS_2 TaxID=3055789 RepID=UPI003654306E
MNSQNKVTHFFYQNGNLVTVNDSDSKRSIIRNAHMPLAEQCFTDGGGSLLASDEKGSVLAVSQKDDEKKSP